MRNNNFKKTSQDYLEFKGKTCWEPWIKVKSYNCLFLTDALQFLCYKSTCFNGFNLGVNFIVS